MEAGKDPLDLGEIQLAVGSAVEVAVDQGAERVDLDLGGRWLDHEILSAPVAHDVALFENVPPGEATLRAFAERRLLCEKPVQIAAEGPVALECLDDDFPVAGHVKIGATPAGPGTLIWMPEQASEVHAVIVNEQSRGAVRQKIFGNGKPHVRVVVNDSGWFETSELSRDRWSVTFSGAARTSAPIEVNLAQATQNLELVFPAGEMEGWVTHKGEPIEAAIVRSLDGSLAAMTDAEGRFHWRGVAPRTYRLMAQKDRLSSQIVKIDVAPAGSSDEPIELTLEAKEISLSIAIEDGGSHPVFIEDAVGLRTMTTLAGSVEVKLHPGTDRARIAAFVDDRLVLAEWSSADGSEVILSSEKSTAELQLTCRADDAGAVPQIEHAGWDVSWLYSLHGRILRCGPTPLFLGGLPPGEYWITIADNPPIRAIANPESIVIIDRGDG